MLSTIIAIGWRIELRGILTVIIAVVTLCGSVYLLLGTNIGARLGFLVSIAGLAGWMAMMGLVWWIYGIGLKGPEPSWKLERSIALDGNLRTIGVLNEAPPSPADPDDVNGENLKEVGWRLLSLEDKARGQAIASAQELLSEADIDFSKLVAGNVYLKGGERYPKINNKIDFVAFLHKPGYAIVELQASEAVVPEPGRAPAVPVADPTKPKEYVMMIRDLGAKRQPAVFLTFGGGLIFLILCWMLHSRDRIWAKHTGKSLERVAAGA